MPSISRKKQTVRINAGEFRSRRISFPSREGLRPTADRVRETLFNWLQPVITGARCLDLFAGSGALGIEALSRGARAVDFVESDRLVAQSIARNLSELACHSARVFNCSAEGWLRGDQQSGQIHPPHHDSAAAGTVRSPARPNTATDTVLPLEKIDIAFLDPPFAANSLFETANLLSQSRLLADRAWVYLESGQAINQQELPDMFTIYRSKRAGDVHYVLCQIEV
jgi:16S rRNA (guanine966-N2)-methyltransferase